MVATLILASLFTAGLLFAPPEKLSIQGGFNDQGQPTFVVNNTGSVDVSVTQIRLQTEGSNLLVYATQLSWNQVPAGSAVLIVATFQGITFQPNTLYNFTLITAKGDKFPASASYVTYTFVVQLNIVGATIDTSTGTVTFNLANSGTTDVVIATASVTGGTFNNAAGTITSSGTRPCNVTNGQATVPKGASCTMTATFGTGFVAGTTYTFILASTQGHRFPYTTTA